MLPGHLASSSPPSTIPPIIFEYRPDLGLVSSYEFTLATNIRHHFTASSLGIQDFYDLLLLDLQQTVPLADRMPVVISKCRYVHLILLKKLLTEFFKTKCHYLSVGSYQTVGLIFCFLVAWCLCVCLYASGRAPVIYNLPGPHYLLRLLKIQEAITRDSYKQWLELILSVELYSFFLSFIKIRNSLLQHIAS